MTFLNEFNRKVNGSLIYIVEVLASVVVFILDLLQSSLHEWFQVLFPLIGVKINGPDPWDIQVKDKRFYAMVIAKTSTGFIDAFCKGYIECDDIEEFIFRFMQSSVVCFISYYHPYKVSKELIHRWFDVQTEENTCNTVGKHYDEQATLTYKDITMNVAQYSAGYFTKSDIPSFRSYNEAEQYANASAVRMRELIAKKLKLEPGMRVLDIGCGFGGLAKYLAKTYQVHVTGVTVSHDMAEQARKYCKGLNVDIECMDYRGITGKFDRVTCIEMFCHVGEHHHREFFEHVYEWLKDDSLLLMQTISVNHRFVESYMPFFESHLHFYAHMSRPEEIIKHSTGLFIIEDWRNYGYHFGLTGQSNTQMLKLFVKENAKKSDETLYRHLLFYGAAVSGLARNRRIQLYSIVFSKDGMKHVYDY